MAYEQRDNSGTLFKNEKKTEGDNKPNMTGKAMIDGVMYFFDAWTKEGSKGRFQSVSFKRMDKQEGYQGGTGQPDKPQRGERDKASFPDPDLDGPPF